MKKYVIGIDFGTLSGRALLVDASDGRAVAESVYEYPHGVMDERLPDGTPLAPRSALQHPADYIDVLRNTVPDILASSGVDKADVAAMAIDFTTCTMLPLDKEGMPLCFGEKYASEPNAYVKLWKHHASQPQADRINKVAAERGEKWHAIYGGKVSSEWMIPKILQILEESPEIYEDTYRFSEAADWLSLLLTGNETHAPGFAGFKALWNAEDGYPSKEFFRALHPRMENIVGTKLSENIPSVDSIAGYLSESGAALLGLEAGIPVALPVLDAQAALPALGIIGDGEMMMILGTSGVYIINDKNKVPAEGICGYVKDGIYKGYYTYEAGQASLGDGYDWFVRNFVPEEYTAEARKRGISIHKLLRQKAQGLKVGESGIMVLDWFNGNRSVLADADLSGMILGLTLRTKPEDIYRAIIEASAFGARIIIEAYEKNGVEVKTICASGGIALKDEMLMQIFADVTGRQLKVAGAPQAAALGSAVRAAVAGGIYGSMEEAIKVMSVPAARIYTPIPENVSAYEKLYEEYKTLHDYFGRGGNDVMKRLGK
ncbi:MAG: ribulokinase [Clostridia bacterium]|nr:ribulokinase [Clostridia bacterium]